jgi:molecular chaperone DnaJ
VAPQREWFEKDYYKTLGVASTAPAKDITRAYRKLARQFHPDTNPDNASAEDRFKEISAAYDVLGDETRRKEYDEVRTLGPMGGGRTMPGGFGAGRGGDFMDLGDVFGGLFGGGGGRSRRGPAMHNRGVDLQTELTLSFREAAAGLTTSLHVVGDAVCETCAGSGARPGTTPTVCGICAGSGQVAEDQGRFSFSAPCRACHGRGRIIGDPCPGCSGRGTNQRDREVKVRIPAGVADNQAIRLPGRGGPGQRGGEPGDLHVVIHVTPDPLFGRDGANLTLQVPITYPEAALGAAVTVPTLDGEPITLKIPPGTRSGRTLRVRGRGLHTASHHGDLLVTVEVTVPASLTPEQRTAIEALAAATPSSPRSHLGV